MQEQYFWIECFLGQIFKYLNAWKKKIDSRDNKRFRALTRSSNLDLLKLWLRENNKLNLFEPWRRFLASCATEAAKFHACSFKRGKKNGEPSADSISSSGTRVAHIFPRRLQEPVRIFGMSSWMNVISLFHSIYTIYTRFSFIILSLFRSFKDSKINSWKKKNK